jgi:hypothetical protein
MRESEWILTSSIGMPDRYSMEALSRAGKPALLRVESAAAPVLRVRASVGTDHVDAAVTVLIDAALYW